MPGYASPSWHMCTTERLRMRISSSNVQQWEGRLTESCAPKMTTQVYIDPCKRELSDLSAAWLSSLPSTHSPRASIAQTLETDDYLQMPSTLREPLISPLIDHHLAEALA
ncbi:hypothetical protein PGT21_015701 [Puccinia graminis f. sp. tritici]|uniref:Uncharacterized protein n=1 Tax=Puccinia graminis f. sp. tritici TaxID=56615 RepID=A0A5B0LYU8_PUCGR|nr:hypothetical protein PGT21_015701 [Puccinia graminis f. sp. tritici]